MYEYEFRLIIDGIFQDLETLFPCYKYIIEYVKPHFRCRNKLWETKRKLRSVITYYDGLWFKLVESEEKLYKEWTLSTHKKFYRNTVSFQNPFTIEHRIQTDFGKNAKLYQFHRGDVAGLVFELEIGVFTKRKKSMSHLLRHMEGLKEFREKVFYLFRNKPHPTYVLKPCKRKPVRAVESIQLSENILVARKYDGVFGFVYSYTDRICEYWEGNERCVKRGLSLGDGIVYGAEKLNDYTIILLDVYQVRGLPVVGRKSVLTEFLPFVPLVTGYQVQSYQRNVPPMVDHLPTDGYIFHDVSKDIIYKQKGTHTVDLVYLKGHFLLPNGKMIETTKILEDGVVYEVKISGQDFEIVKKRGDRFVGNTEKQIKDIFDIILH